MQKTYCDGCGVELIEIPVFHNGFGLVPIANEFNGTFDKNTLTVDSKTYDLCDACKKRIKGAVIAELEAIKKEV